MPLPGVIGLRRSTSAGFDPRLERLDLGRKIGNGGGRAGNLAQRRVEIGHVLLHRGLVLFGVLREPRHQSLHVGLAGRQFGAGRVLRVAFDPGFIDGRRVTGLQDCHHRLLVFGLPAGRHGEDRQFVGQNGLELLVQIADLAGNSAGRCLLQRAQENWRTAARA